MRTQFCLAAAAFTLLTSGAEALSLKPAASIGAADVTLIAKRHRTSLPKDCTRYNGRHGFYGNIWCSEAEQRAWDIYSSSRSVNATRR